MYLSDEYNAVVLHCSVHLWFSRLERHSLLFCFVTPTMLMTYAWWRTFLWRLFHLILIAFVGKRGIRMYRLKMDFTPIFWDTCPPHITIPTVWAIWAVSCPLTSLWWKQLKCLFFSKMTPQPQEESRKRSPEDYIFGKVIGEGSFSTVYLAKDIHTSKEFASK